MYIYVRCVIYAMQIQDMRNANGILEIIWFNPFHYSPDELCQDLVPITYDWEMVSDLEKGGHEMSLMK